MYSVPVIPPDLRHEETIIQAANALNCLQSTITNIFDRIDSRIAKNNDKINELSSRITSATHKIQNLGGTNKAIKIFSPAKFPASHVFRNIEATFNNMPAVESTPNILIDQEITSRVDLGPSNIQDKLVFFHYRSTKAKSTAVGVSSHRDLGSIPNNCKSINSVLLFSTAENVYGARKLTDDMNRAQRNRNKGANTNKENGPNLILEPAPLSLSNRKVGAEKRHQGLFYTPKLNEAPTIDLPADLKDLPGIAGDIHFDHVDTHQIAPSLFIDNYISMPKEAAVPTERAEIKNEVPSLVSNTAERPRSPVNTIPIPPPPPPALADVSNVPPPPPPAPKTEHQEASSKAISLPVISAPETDIRSNLMDAIRKAGGARGGRLRAAADVARQASNERLDSVPDKPKVVSGGDLMADLHYKLLMRRKGISGAKDGQSNLPDGGGVMSRLSSLIPPPPVKNINSSSEEDDAGDDADWAD